MNFQNEHKHVFITSFKKIEIISTQNLPPAGNHILTFNIIG